MTDTVNILQGSAFVTSDQRGDIHGTPVSPHGLFALDTRFLSRWILTVDGQSPAVLSTDTQRYYTAQFFLAPSTGTMYINSPMSVVRRRRIDETGMREEIGVFNHTPDPRDVAVRLEVDADFADLFEVKDALEKKGRLYRRVEEQALVMGYEREGFVRETRIGVSDPAAQISDDGFEFALHLEPHGRWVAEFTVQPVAEGFVFPERALAAEQQAADLTGWRARAPRVECDWRPLERAYERSIEDLAALRLELPNRPGAALPAAGLPWFMAMFGRDSIITSYQALPFTPELALGTLETLAAMQGTRMDDFRDEEPGKILHEMRYGELTAFEERPHSPYFGAADSTTLWLILLHEYVQWSGRADVARQLEPVARNAIEWIDRYGDRDGDGYIEYERRNTETGLENQCWKDSWDSIRFSDGRMASLPIATCELQGYAYDAKVRSAELARKVWNDPALAERLDREAAELKERFNRNFWLEDRGYFALALDGEKQKVDALTSNVGHLLWSGIVDDDKVARCVQHLMDERMFSGWGIRTMALGEGAYNPIGYHVGTVWPHDNSIIAMGLCRYGYRNEASRIAQAMIEVSSFFDYRLPEAFAGYPREYTYYPAEYPTACSPQAWATGTPLLLLRVILGLEPRGAILHSEPALPESVNRVEVRGIPGIWGTMDVGGDAASTIFGALGAAATEAKPAVQELFATIDQRLPPAATRSIKGSVRFDLGEAGSWRIGIDRGKVSVAKTTADADCVFELSEDTLVGILRGEQNARTARLSGKVKVHGDFAMATKFAELTTASAAQRHDGG